jgi:uncharacterized protein
MGKLFRNIQNSAEVLKATKRVNFVLILTTVLYLIAIGFNCLFGIMREKDLVWLDFPGEEKRLTELFIQTILLAPIIETFLNQYVPYIILNKIRFTRERRYLIILFSGLLFGLIHCYSLFYIFYAFLLGLIFMYGYMIRIKTDNKTFFLIAICHSLLNIGIFLFKII